MNHKKILSVLGLMAIVLVMSQCKKDTISPDPITYDTTSYNLQTGAFPAPVFTDNTPTNAGVLLGRMLFYEKLLSKNNTQSCANCHIQSHGFTDTARFSLGVEGRRGGRQAMSVFNTAWHTKGFFWDGRSTLLRHQSLMPIQDPLEMNETLENVVAKLSAKKEYKDQFFRAFGNSEVNAEKISLAMEQFMNSIISNQSKYDKFLAGSATLSENEERGRKLFFTEYNEFFPAQSGADCAHCHSGFNFSNNDYRNNGLDLASDIVDIGREKVTQNIADKGKFKVTSLRNIALTAPYMHDGRFGTLEEVIDHYNSGIKLSPSLDAALQATMGTGLRLTAQNKADLVAFLNTLTDNTLATDSRYTDPHR